MASVPSFASHWVTVGTPPGDPHGRIVVDTDSLQKRDRFIIVDIMTVYAAPIVNSYGITLDRFVQRTAFECADRLFVRVTTTGYLEDKRVGSSAATTDWKSGLIPLPNDATSNRIYELVCKSAAPTRAAR